MKIYDMIIIGAGPAGMSAALFAEGDGLEFKIIENNKPGGIVEETINTNFTRLENYLGLYGLNGTQTKKKFTEHLKSRNIHIEKRNVENIFDEGEILTIKSGKTLIYTRSIILATGTVPKKAEIKGIELVPKKIYYGIQPHKVKQYFGKDVIVIGGRNHGLVTAIKLKQLGCKPIIVEKNTILPGKAKYISKLKELKIPYILNSIPKEIVGKNKINFIRIESNGIEKKYYPSAIFCCIGYAPNSNLAKILKIKVDKDGFIKVDRKMQTSNKKIYAAGDVTGGVKMIAKAVGEGATAEYYANNYLKFIKKKQVGKTNE